MNKILLVTMLLIGIATSLSAAFTYDQLKKAKDTCYSGNNKMCSALGNAYLRGVQVK